MEEKLKEQNKLFIEILKRFKDEGILKSIILIGSWCIPLYKKYFNELKNLSPIRTRDMDFLVPLDAQFKNKVDLTDLLKDLGFVDKFHGQQGYIKLIHSLLILEFLVPEIGRGSDKPYKLPKLGINAQRLRFLDMLVEDTIKIKTEGIEIILPHPVNYAFHKLLISKRREGVNKKEKAEKDKKVAMQILAALIDAGETAPIKGIFRALYEKRQRKIIEVLKEETEDSILKILEEARI